MSVNEVPTTETTETTIHREPNDAEDEKRRAAYQKNRLPEKPPTVVNDRPVGSGTVADVRNGGGRNPLGD